MNEAKFISELKSQFNGETVEFAGETTFIARKEDLVVVVQKIKAMGFERLSALTAVDYFPAEEPRFHIVYIFTSVRNQAALSLRIPVPGISPAVTTIETVYPNANWRERELYDMFGINIEGHSDLRRIMMPHDWEGHPLRKDYPLGYEEPQYTFNAAEIDAHKPYAKE